MLLNPGKLEYQAYLSNHQPYLGEVGDDLSAFHAGIVVFINKQGLDDHENLVDVRTHKVI